MRTLASPSVSHLAIARLKGSDPTPSRLTALLGFEDATDLPVRELRWLFAARAWIGAARAGRNPRAAVAKALGSSAGAASFGLFIEQLIFAWPEPFTAGMPDCLWLRPDEKLFVDVLAAASEEDRQGFNAFLRGMLPETVRERLYMLALRLHDQFDGSLA